MHLQFQNPQSILFKVSRIETQKVHFNLSDTSAHPICFKMLSISRKKKSELRWSFLMDTKLPSSLGQQISFNLFNLKRGWVYK